ncbi:MAG: hypothetical protein GF313_14485 [Caldithrix sp.]|nr:hypothetical protein [Caldithrix sp.]
MTPNIDSTLADSTLYGVQNIVANNGHNLAVSGIIIVFAGLVFIALVIIAFNRFVAPSDRSTGSPLEPTPDWEDASLAGKQSHAIPLDHLAAITAAIELYRRLHFDALESSVTFNRGEIQTGWKLGYKYGQRSQARK